MGLGFVPAPVHVVVLAEQFQRALFWMVDTLPGLVPSMFARHSLPRHILKMEDDDFLQIDYRSIGRIWDASIMNASAIVFRAVIHKATGNRIGRNPRFSKPGRTLTHGNRKTPRCRFVLTLDFLSSWPRALRPRRARAATAFIEVARGIQEKPLPSAVSDFAHLGQTLLLERSVESARVAESNTCRAVCHNDRPWSAAVEHERPVFANAESHNAGPVCLSRRKLFGRKKSAALPFTNI